MYAYDAKQADEFSPLSQLMHLIKELHREKPTNVSNPDKATRFVFTSLTEIERETNTPVLIRTVTKPML